MSSMFPSCMQAMSWKARDRLCGIQPMTAGTPMSGVLAPLPSRRDLGQHMEAFALWTSSGWPSTISSGRL